MSEQDFIQWHRPRLMALIDEGVDYLAIETFPSLKEAKAVLELLRIEAPDIPTWISFSCKVLSFVLIEALLSEFRLGRRALVSRRIVQ